MEGGVMAYWGNGLRLIDLREAVEELHIDEYGGRLEDGLWFWVDYDTKTGIAYSYFSGAVAGHDWLDRKELPDVLPRSRRSPKGRKP